MQRQETRSYRSIFVSVTEDKKLQQQKFLVLVAEDKKLSVYLTSSQQIEVAFQD